MKNVFLTCLALCLAGTLCAQGELFTPTTLKSDDLAAFERRAEPTVASQWALEDPSALAVMLAKAPREDDYQAGQELLLSLPHPDGKTSTFKITRYQMITDELQAAFPTYVTAYGWDVDAPYRKVFLEWTALGFGASITGGTEGRWNIAPTYNLRNDLYQSFYTRDVARDTEAYSCGFEPNEGLREELKDFHPSTKMVGDCELREYDLALACTGEYFQTVGNTQALVVAEMMTAINRVNEVFRADLAITLKIINLPDGNGDFQLIYSNPNTDPYTNSNTSAMLDENQTTVDAVIGSTNYDIGHVFSTSSGGVASLGSPCNSSVKARGVTGLPNPTGDPFYIDFVAHEMGHQFGGNHTFNSTNGNCIQRNAGTAYEPGSGSTVQAYAGICSEPSDPSANVQRNSDPYYHAISIQEISAYMELGGGASCATTLQTDNDEPTVGAGTDYVIPTNTPFVLTATSTDPNGDALTYCWEQFDLGAVVPAMPTGLETDAPLFRSLPPVASPERYFPALDAIVAGATPWEVLPLVARDMNFIVTVRDFGAAGYGCTVQDQTTITVVNTGAQYAVQSPNGGEVWQAGGSVPVTWNVAGTDAGTIACANVDIVLSTDGGLTFDQVLATVPNNGSATLTAPTVTETSARIMVRCSDNIFFDISDADFSIEQTDYNFEPTNSAASACNGETTADFSFDLESLQGYTGTVNYSGSNLPGGVAITFNPASTSLTAGQEASVDFTLSNLGGVAPGEYTFQVITDDGGTPKSEDFVLTVKAPLAAPTLLMPANNGFTPANAASFNWSSVPGATAYRWVVCRNADCTSFVNFTTTNLGVNFDLTGNNISDGDMLTWFVEAIDEECDPEARTPSEMFNVTFGQTPTTGSSLVSGNSPIEICEGESNDETYSIGFFDADLTGPATLAPTGIPVGLTVDITPTTLSNGENATVSFTGEENLAAGTYQITITADDNTNTESIDLELIVTDDAVISPADGQEFMLSANPGCSSNDGAVFVTFEFDPFPAGATVTEYNLLVFTDNGAFSPAPISPNSPQTQGYCVDDGDQLTYVIEATLADGSTVRSCERSFVARTALPVNWLSFTAEPAGKTALLNWSVEQDALNEGFTIERTNEDATTWQTVGYEPRTGPDGVAAYQFSDERVAAGTTYHYRLRQEDTDGANSFSPIQTVIFGVTSGLVATPNPANEFINLDAGLDTQETLRYTFYDPAGRQVAQGDLPGGRGQVALDELPPAIYQVLVTDGSGYREVIRIIKR